MWNVEKAKKILEEYGAQRFIVDVDGKVYALGHTNPVEVVGLKFSNDYDVVVNTTSQAIDKAKKTTRR